MERVRKAALLDPLKRGDGSCELTRLLLASVSSFTEILYLKVLTGGFLASDKFLSFRNYVYVISCELLKCIAFMHMLARILHH